MFSSTRSKPTPISTSLTPSEVEQRKLRIRANLIKYRTFDVPMEECQWEHTSNWYRKPEVQAQFGWEMTQAFRAGFSITPSSGTLEADFGIAGTIITPRKANLGAVIFDMLLVMKISKSELPKPGQFIEIKELSACDIKRKLHKRFTGEQFVRTSMIQGAKFKTTAVNLDDITNDAASSYSSDECEEEL